MKRVLSEVSQNPSQVDEQTVKSKSPPGSVHTATGGQQKKETPVLSEESLKNLAKVIGDEGGLVVAMYLNIPTTTLVNMRLKGTEKNLAEVDMTRNMLLYWKKMRQTAKEKDKVLDLERALRHWGKKPELADVLLDRHKDNLELTPDCFN